MKYQLFTIFIFTSFLTLAQNVLRQKQIGITYAIGDSAPLSFQSLDGAGSHSSGWYEKIGLLSMLPVNRSVDLEIGIEYSKHHNLSFSPAFYPDIPDTTYYGGKSLFAIPVQARIHFWKICFINSGIVLAYDRDDSFAYFHDQTGIGFNLGAGLQHNFNSRLSLFVNPYLRFYSIISFIEKGHQNLTESGFRFGITYSISTIKS